MTNFSNLLGGKLPAQSAIKSLMSLSPQMKAFFGMAAASGLGLDQAFNALQSVFEAPGAKQKKQAIQQRVQQGVARPEEERAATTMQQQDIGQLKGIAVPAAAALAGAGAARAGGIQGILGQLTGEQAQKQPGRQQSYFERAMEGLSFLDLPDTARTAVGPVMKQLDTLEAQGVPWEDKAVQRLASQARSMASQPTMAGQEEARFQEAYGQQQQPQQQAGGGQEQLMAQMQALIGALRG